MIISMKENIIQEITKIIHFGSFKALVIHSYLYMNLYVVSIFPPDCLHCDFWCKVKRCSVVQSGVCMSVKSLLSLESPRFTMR